MEIASKTSMPLPRNDGFELRTSNSNEARLRAASEGFEALFLQQMMKAGRSASLSDGLFDGTGMDTTNSMLDRAITETGAGRSNLGLADAIYRQFSGYAGKAR